MNNSHINNNYYNNNQEAYHLIIVMILYKIKIRLLNNCKQTPINL